MAVQSTHESLCNDHPSAVDNRKGSTNMGALHMENETMIPRRRGVPHLTREVARACLFPEVSATWLTSWRAMVLEFRGSTPATRAASDAANRAWVREQLARAQRVEAALEHLRAGAVGAALQLLEGRAA